MYFLIFMWALLIPIMFMLADLKRGYNGTGGELVWLLLPLIVWYIWNEVQRKKEKE